MKAALESPDACAIHAKNQQPKGEAELRTPQLWLQLNREEPFSLPGQVIIGIIFGYYTLGLYQLGFQFLMLLSIIPGNLYQYLLPEESSGKNKREIKLSGLIFSVAVALTTFTISPYLIENLFPTFIDSIQIVKVMSLAVIPSTIVAMLTASHLGKERSKTVFTAGLVYLASLITGLIVVGKIMGVLGLALTLVIAQALQAIYLGTNKSP